MAHVVRAALDNGYVSLRRADKNGEKRKTDRVRAFIVSPIERISFRREIVD